MIFTIADPRYASRLDDKQDVKMPRVRGAITLNAELKDESTWLELTSQHRGFPMRQVGGEVRKERAENSYSRQSECSHMVASFGACDADFILNENRLL